MSRRLRAVWILVGVLALFLLAEHGAYRSYFQDDDLDTLSWTPGPAWSYYFTALISPKYFPSNFRPTGHVYYRVLNSLVGLNFAVYVAVLQGFHLINYTLLWAVLRRFGFGLMATAAGVVFMAFHKAVLDAYWRPMYVFDVLCATFCLLALLFYMQRRWIWAFAAFWIAYRAKELAVMLPVVLALYEYWFGDKNWKRLVPFFLVSASFGIQAMLFSHKSPGAYTMQFMPTVIWQSAKFYAQKFLFAYSGILVLLLAWFVRDRRLYLGLTTFWLLLLPMLPLPLRQNRVYLYIPLIGAAFVVAVLVERWRRLMVPLLAVWLVVFGVELVRYQGRELARAEENRNFVTAVRNFVRGHPVTLTYIYDGAPPNMRWWGVNGTLYYSLRERGWRNEELHVGWTGDERTRPFYSEIPRSEMHWDAAARALTITAVP